MIPVPKRKVALPTLIHSGVVRAAPPAEGDGLLLPDGRAIAKSACREWAQTKGPPVSGRP